MDSLFADIRFALRQLLRTPGFTLVVLLVLGLGIGLNTAIFSVVDAVLLRPLPYPEADRLVLVYGTVPERDVQRGWTSPLNYVDLREQSRSLASVAAWQFTEVTLSGEASARQLRGAAVAADFFQVFRTEAALGRTFTADEDRPGDGRFVLLSHGLWQSQFGADQAAIGRSVLLDGESAVIVGVMPPAFDFPVGAELWQPLQLNPPEQDRGSHNLSLVARLAPGFSLAEARNDLATIARRLGEEYPESNGNRGFAVAPLKEELVGNVRTGLLVLGGAMGLVLLIACANIANLLLARSAARGTEIAMRTALGAARPRIVRQLLTENLVLALGAVLCGLLIGHWGVRFFIRLGPEDIPRLAEVGLDARAVGFALALGVLTVALFGLAPALQVSKLDLQGVLKEGARQAGSSRGRRRALGVLVVTEVMLSLALMIGAGLLVKSFLRLTQVDPGFQPSRILTLNASPPSWKYDPIRALDFYDRLLQRLSALPGVESVAATMSRPILSENSWATGISIEGRPSDETDSLRAGLNPVTTGYFLTLGIPLIEGRGFEGSDDLSAPGVAILSESAARLFFPAEDPIDKTFTHNLDLGPGVATTRTVVGVVGDVRQSGLASDEEPIIYVPYRQMPFPRLSLVVRTAGDPLSYAAAVREAIWEIDAQVPLEEVTTLRAILSNSVSQPRLYMALLVAFAVMALILAAVGVYGVLSHMVVQRHHEIGVRMALGARRGDIVSLIVGQAAPLAAIGLVLGIAGSLALSRLITSLLYDVEPSDPLTYLTVSGVLLGSMLLACLVPALRATRFNPVDSLRSE